MKKKMQEGMAFELEGICIPVVIGDKEYELQEASAASACLWQNDLLAKAKMGPDGKVQSAKGIADSEPYLVHLCIVDSEGVRVPLNVVRSWPSKIVKQLFKKAKEISGLDEKEEDKDSAKNEQNDTLDG